jgi:hypothetical protein
LKWEEKGGSEEKKWVVPSICCCWFSLVVFKVSPPPKPPPLFASATLSVYIYLSLSAQVMGAERKSSEQGGISGPCAKN